MLRRTLAIGATAAVLALLVSPPATAQNNLDFESYGAGAVASALQLSLGEDAEIAFSTTNASVGSAPEAKADGQAMSSPLFSTEGAPVESTGAVVTGQDCSADEELPAPLDLLGVVIACVNTSAGVVDGHPEATSESDEIVIDVISAELVGQISEMALRPLLEQLLAPLSELVDLTEVIDLLLESLEAGDTLATVEVAPTFSAATDIVGEAGAQGAEILLLPGLEGFGPLATVTVGDSFAKVEVDPATGEATSTGKAAFLEVDLDNLGALLDALVAEIEDALGEEAGPLFELLDPIVAEVTALLGTLDETIEETVNVTVEDLACGPENPLTALVCFSAGSVRALSDEELQAFGFTFGEGTEGILAEILGLSVGEGALVLGVGTTAAAANAILATPPAPPTTTPTDVPLPRTGGDATMPLALTLFAAAAGGVALVRRSRSI